MRDITTAIVHCSATTKDMDIGVEEIRRWHKAKGWRDIGYHYVIRRGRGSINSAWPLVEIGRDISIVGAHVKGENENSIGICLVGGLADDGYTSEFNFTSSQMGCLDFLLRYLAIENGPLDTYGHNQFSEKDCPCFNVKEWIL